MSSPVITLTTDFGEGSSYSAAMKGAILAVNPAAHIVDLTHAVPPQGLRSAAFFLAEAVPYFPAGTIHVVVVDPGVGTNRAILCVRWNAQLLVVPDNGCWTSLEPAAQSLEVFRVTNTRYWAGTVSDTFHGRDIFAPVAAHLSLGVEPSELGPRVSEWVRLRLPPAERTPFAIHGEVVRVDRFGNLITNITRGDMGDFRTVELAEVRVSRWVQTYGDAEPGEAVALIGSSGFLEVAVVNGSAAERLGQGVGAAVAVRAAE